MSNITNAPRSVQGIFALHVTTASLALVFTLIALWLALRRLKNSSAWRETNRQRLSDGEAPLKSSVWTYAFLIPALLCLSVGYATLAGVVALQVTSNSPVSVTSPFSHRYDSATSSAKGTTVSALSYNNALATVLTSVGLTGGVWLHSVNLKSNGTGVTSPGVWSRAWNTFILLTMLALGVGSWARGMAVRNDQIYPTTLQTDLATRALYIAHRVWVILSSTSVTVQVVGYYLALKKNSGPGVSRAVTSQGLELTSQCIERPILTRFTYIVVPVVWLRNAFTIFDIVLLYVDTRGWSDTTDTAVAFLLIVFGQIANLAILGMILYGAWSNGISVGRGRQGYSKSRGSYET